MALGQSEIEREVLQPSKRPEIQKAIAHQDWIKLHADTNLDVINSVPFRKFVLFARSQLPEDKFLTTMNNIKFPLPTNSITTDGTRHSTISSTIRGKETTGSGIGRKFLTSLICGRKRLGGSSRLKSIPSLSWTCLRIPTRQTNIRSLIPISYR